MTYTPETAKEILANRLRSLRENAAAYPEHAERLEALIKHYASGGGPENPPLDAVPGKLSLREANMLDDDVSTLYWWYADPDRRHMQSLQYPTHALNKRRIAADRRRRAEDKRNPLNINLD